jgi:hypothetical protein
MARSGVKEDHTASYFSHNNAEATRLRDQLAADSLDMLIQWLRDGGNVGVHGTSCIHPYHLGICQCLTPRLDATNSTRERRFVLLRVSPTGTR